VTLVLCWYDDGLCPNRIVMVADARASLEKGAITYTDDAVKLFELGICFRTLPLLPTEDEGWPQYFATKFVIGYSGDCFESMTIVAWPQRYCRRLLSKPTCTSAEGHRDRASFEDLAGAVRAATTAFRRRRKYKMEGRIQFLLAGYCPVKALPHAAIIECGAKNDDAELTHLSQLVSGQPWMIGDIHRSAKEATERLQARIQKARLDFDKKAHGQIDADVETARRGHVQGKQLEEMVLTAVGDEFRLTIGGPVDKLELVLKEGRGVLDVTAQADAATIPDLLPDLAQGTVQYTKIGQTFGR
jgi:hypothetical protein